VPERASQRDRTAMSQVPFTTWISAAWVNGAGYRCTTKRWVLRLAPRLGTTTLRHYSIPVTGYSRSPANSAEIGTFPLKIGYPPSRLHRPERPEIANRI